MSTNYIIWGISDSGYKEAISSSFLNNILPPAFKESVSDKHRTIADSFSGDNPSNDYFYSIETIGNSVLYTIYRTNWYRDGRLAYDAATIIIDNTQIIENAFRFLQLLIKTYALKKESGIAEFNFDNVISQINPRAKQLTEKRSLSRKYKQGFIKYQSETELSAIFSDKQDKLHNFNKVYFFTKLSYLEQGQFKLQDLNDYKQIPIRLVNYNPEYYRVYVAGREANVFSNTFNAYDGEEILIKANKTQDSHDIAKPGLTIPLKKIEPPKPQPTTQHHSNSGYKKKKGNMQLVLIACFLLVVFGLGIWFFLPKRVVTICGWPPLQATCEIALKDGIFTNIGNNEQIKDAEKLLECFKSGSIIVEDGETTQNHRYKLIEDDNGIKMQTKKEDGTWSDDWTPLDDINNLEDLVKTLKESDKNGVSKMVVEAIDKVINYLQIQSSEGLSGSENIWKLKVLDLSYKPKTPQAIADTIFKNVDKLITEYVGLKDLLKEKLPKSIFVAIIEENEKKYKNAVEVVPEETLEIDPEVNKKKEEDAKKKKEEEAKNKKEEANNNQSPTTSCTDNHPERTEMRTLATSIKDAKRLIKKGSETAEGEKKLKSEIESNCKKLQEMKNKLKNCEHKVGLLSIINGASCNN